MSSLDDIRQQEEDIFGELGSYDFSEPPKFAKGSAKDKALKQLAVSEDSPFSTIGQELSKADLIRLKRERTALLREETEEIKRQLEIVKRRLNELKPNHSTVGRVADNNGQAASSGASAEPSRVKSSEEKLSNEKENSANQTTTTKQQSCSTISTIAERVCSEEREANEEVKAKRPAAQLSEPPPPHHHHPTLNPHQRLSSKDAHRADAKFRPLTGKADCPNCTCDRRTSVCDQCINLALVATTKQLHQRPKAAAAATATTAASNRRAQDLASSLSASFVPLKNDNDPRPSERRHAPTSQFIENPDDRPIRPAKERVLATVESIDDRLVPGKVYTISKSLNEKRTKLAQAIDDLQLMMDQVKEKGNKLEEQRKVAQLYKEQWKFGPTIGGPSASARQKLGGPSMSQRRNYESRLDANLSRDFKSLMGFQHIESTIRLRNTQYGSNSNLAASTVSSRMKAKQGAQHSQSRSKSLESLAGKGAGGRTRAAMPGGARPSMAQMGGARFYNGKSSSEINLSSTAAAAATLSSSAAKNRIVESSEEVRVNKAADGSGDDDDGDDDDDDDEDDNSVEKVNVEDIEDRRSEQHEPTMQPRAQSAKLDDQAPAATAAAAATPTVQKMSWIPVFGETEIKTVKRAPTRRKVQIVEANGRSADRTPQQQQQRIGDGRRIVQAQAQTQTQSSTSQRRPGSGFTSQQASFSRAHTFSKEIASNTSADRLMVDAKRKLKFATELLEQEQRDSGSTQLVINRTMAPPVPKPRNRDGQLMSATTATRATKGGHRAAATPAAAAATTPTTTTTTTTTTTPTKAITPNNDFSLGSEQTNGSRAADAQTLKEISRLEEMLNEQQRLLARLTQAHDRQHIVSPAITVRCSSPCCHHTNSSFGCGRRLAAGGAGVGGLIAGPAGLPSSNKLLVNNLRDRLNKTKIRLAKTLEEEREKHQQLRKKVDSSLRKQSDLENENELLKQSLSKCIDTCLKDISNTFESLSDTLADSISNINSNQQQQAQAQARDGDGGGGARDRISRPMSDNESSQAVLSNAAQLITDNRLLKQMKGHIVAIEQQRKGIFEELSREKQRSNQLEMKLRQSQAELNRLMEAERRLGMQTAIEPANNVSKTQQEDDLSIANQLQHQHLAADQREQETEQQQARLVAAAASMANADNGDKIKSADNDSPQPSTSTSPYDQQQQRQQHQQTTTASSNIQVSSIQLDSELDDSYNSIDVYGRFLERLTPDIESIRRERKHLFDNLKKILSKIDSN